MQTRTGTQHPALYRLRLLYFASWCAYGRDNRVGGLVPVAVTFEILRNQETTPYFSAVSPSLKQDRFSF